MFSDKLARAIRREIDDHDQELGDELDGVEEIVDDNLSGEEYNEYQALIEALGIEAVTKEIKNRFL